MDASSPFSRGFAQLLTDHPSIKISSLSDSLAISRFLNSVPMILGKFKINISRGDDFFALLKKQGHSFLCLLVMENNKISGLASVVFRKTFICGKLEEVGYLQDLRLGPNLTFARRKEFFSFYSKAIQFAHLMPETQYSRFFYTAILKGNDMARKALSRPSFPLKYSQFVSYKSFIFPKLFLPLKLQPSDKNKMLVELPGPVKNEVEVFFRDNFERAFFSATWDDIERSLPNADVVTLRSEGRIVASCLLVSSISLRSYDVQMPTINFQTQLNGVYPFAVTVCKKSGLKLAGKWKNQLLIKAFLLAQKKPGSFFGIVTADIEPELPLLFRNFPKVCFSGCIYRVFHPEHSKFEDFLKGFLRPIDCVSLEMNLL